jgi:DNA repair exonuclease SbcCD ATPase subunit
MAKKLRTDDIVEKGLFDKPLEETREFLKVVKDLKAEVKELGDELQKSVGKKSPLKDAKDVEKFTNEVKQLEEATKALTDLEKQEAKLKEKLIMLTKEEAINQAKLRVQVQERNKVLKEEAKEQLGLLSTYQKQSKRLNELRKKYKNLVLEQGKNAQGAKELKKEIQELDKALKDVDADVGQFQRSVGNYEKVNSGAKKSFGSLSGFLLGTVVGAFTKSRDEARTFNVGLEQLKTTVKQFAFAAKDYIQNVILPTFENFFLKLKKQGLEAKLFFADLLPDALQSDKTKAKVARLTEEINELNKTIDDNKKTIEETKNPFEGWLDRNEKVRKKVEELYLAIDNATNAIAQWEIEVAKTAKKEEEYQAIADDTTKSFKEREESIKSAAKETAKRSDLELKIAEENLKIAVKKAELDFAEKERLDLYNESLITNLKFLDDKATKDIVGIENLEQLKAAIIGVTEAEKAQQLAIIDNEKTTAELKQDRLERDLDILIDGFDNQKTINERIIADERRTLAEREALLEDTIEKSNNSFEKQKEILNELSEAGVDYNELLGLDAEALNKRIRELEQSEIIEGRTLEVIRERRLVLQDLEEARQEINEAKRKEVLLEVELKGLEENKSDAEISRAVRLEKIKQLKKEISELEKDDLRAIEKKIELEKLEREDEESKEEARKKLIQETTTFIQNELKKRTDLRTKALNEEIDASKEREQQLRDAAANGNLLAEESIAVEKERQAKLTAEREKALKRQKQVEISLAAINAYSNRSRQGDENALGKTIGDITALLSFANNLPAFEDGGLVTGGEQIVRINEKGQEYVIKHDAVNKYGTDMLDAINTGDFSKMEVNRGSGGQTDFNIMMNQALDKVAGEFKKAVSEIPQQRWSMSEITGGLKEEIEKGNQLKSRHYRKQKRLS